MGRPKKLQIEIVEDSSTELVETVKTETITDFELNAEIVAGSLKSNAIELRKRIETELKNYSVEKYIDNPDAAKSDKALLNKVKDSIASKRKEVTKAWNQPLDDFLNEMKALENAVSNASSQINEIVKAAENQEKETKRNQIAQYWSTLDFTLVSLERIFNPKWLNKTFQLKDIMLEIEQITEKITTELTTIKSMSDEDSEILCSFYIDTLDLNATLQKGNQLKANREKLKELKPAVTTVTTVQNAEKNGYSEEKPAISILSEDKKTMYVENLSNNGVVGKDVMSFTLKLYGTKEQLVALRKYIDTNGIKYEKI